MTVDSPVDLGRFGTLIGMGAGTYEVYVDVAVLAAWFGLLRDQRHLALITFTNGTAPVGFTTLRVDTRHR